MKLNIYGLPPMTVWDGAGRTLPYDAVLRPSPWRYVSWIANPPDAGCGTFEELLESSTKSDHGETREVDLYEWGAVCWMKE